jgi:hypothetical protein
MGHVGLTRASGAGASPRGRARAAPRALVPRVPAVSLALDPRLAPRPPRVADEARVRRVHADLGGRAPQTATRGQPATPGAGVRRRWVGKGRSRWRAAPTAPRSALHARVGERARSLQGRRGRHRRGARRGVETPATLPPRGGGWALAGRWCAEGCGARPGAWRRAPGSPHAAAAGAAVRPRRSRSGGLGGGAGGRDAWRRPGPRGGPWSDRRVIPRAAGAAPGGQAGGEPRCRASVAAPPAAGASAVVPARMPIASGPRGAPQGLASPVGVGARSGPGRRGPGPRGGLGSAARASAPERPNAGQPTGGLSRLARRRMHPGPRPHPGSPLKPASAPDTAFRPTNWY